ncbi:MAG: thioredoxin-like domain-containing protein [Candidatus Anammoxibacter sp.]
MRKYFIIAYVIIGLLALLLIAANFNLIELEGFKRFKASFRKGHAPELENGRGWLNTDKPVRLSELRGKVVLLDFWTYCCVNCLHTMRDIKKLESKYPNELVVIGVHTGKFTNESETDNIRQAILRLGIKHPVVNDATFAIWHKYNVNAWPTFVLINPEGFVDGYYSGEGNYDALDSKINEIIIKYEEKGLLNNEPLSFVLESDNDVEKILSYPAKVVADEISNRLFIADSNNNRILITDLDGKLIDIVGDSSIGKVDGTFKEASFHHPRGMVYNDDTLYVADTENHLIRKLDLNKKTVSTIAGTGIQAGYMHGGENGTATALNSPLNSPWDLTFVDGRLYIAMAGSHQIWMMDLPNGRIKPFAGNSRQARVDGLLLDGSLAQPSGIVTDGLKLYFTDSETSSIRTADLNPAGMVNSIIGLALFLFGDKDGIGGDVRLQHPLGILLHDGMVYISDTYNHKIKVINPQDQSCKTFLGDGKAGNVDGKSSRFYEPDGLAFAKGMLYIADTNNHAIRVADIVTGEVSTLQITGF